MKRILCLTLLMLLSSVAIFSDIARPGKTPQHVPKPRSVDSKMSIMVGANVSVATLRVPKSQLKQLTAELEQLSSDEDNTAAVTGGPSRTQTVVSGIFLSLALVLGGIWFSQSGKLTPSAGKALLFAAAVGVAGIAVTVAYADLAPPPMTAISADIFNGKAFPQEPYITGKVKVEVTSGNEFTMLVPGTMKESNSGEVAAPDNKGQE